MADETGGMSSVERAAQVTATKGAYGEDITDLKKEFESLLTRSKNLIPLPVRLLLNYVRGIDPVDNSFFTKEELDGLREMIIPVIKKKQNSDQYTIRKVGDVLRIPFGSLDYPGGGWSDSRFAKIYVSPNDPDHMAWAWSNSIHRFNMQYNPKNKTVYIEDLYDFNVKEDADFTLKNILTKSLPKTWPHHIAEWAVRQIRNSANEFAVKISLEDINI